MARYRVAYTTYESAPEGRTTTVDAAQGVLMLWVQDGDGGGSYSVSVDLARLVSIESVEDPDSAATEEGA